MIEQQILALGNALEQAAQEDNWLRVTQIDKQIATLLPQLAQHRLSDTTLAHLKTLQQRHLCVANQCRTRLDELRQRLQQHQTQRQGLQAYTLFDGETGGTP